MQPGAWLPRQDLPLLPALRGRVRPWGPYWSLGTWAQGHLPVGVSRLVASVWAPRGPGPGVGGTLHRLRAKSLVQKQKSGRQGPQAGPQGVITWFVPLPQPCRECSSFLSHPPGSDG